MKPPSVHILARKRAELSALTQEGAQSAKGAVHTPAPNTGVRGARAWGRPALWFLRALCGGSDQGFSVGKAGGGGPSQTGGVSESRGSLHRDKISTVTYLSLCLSLDIDQF